MLSQYRFELTEEEFIIKEHGEMEAMISCVQLANMCHMVQGSYVSKEEIFLWTQPQQHCHFMRVREAMVKQESRLWIDERKGYLLNMSRP